MSIFDIAHTFTKSQLLAIYESLVQASLSKPAGDINNAFEEMMINLRQLGVS